MYKTYYFVKRINGFCDVANDQCILAQSVWYMIYMFVDNCIRLLVMFYWVEMCNVCRSFARIFNLLDNVRNLLSINVFTHNIRAIYPCTDKSLRWSDFIFSSHESFLLA